MFTVHSPFNSFEALQRAKHVVEQQYAVVGVLEDMNSTLLAFERYIPRFFDGASQLYWGKLFIYSTYNSYVPYLRRMIKRFISIQFIVHYRSGSKLYCFKVLSFTNRLLSSRMYSSLRNNCYLKR